MDVNGANVHVGSEGAPLRISIDVDDALLKEAMRLSGLKTKRAVVEEALRRLVQRRHQARLRELRGAVRWQGDLAASRGARPFPADRDRP